MKSAIVSGFSKFGSYASNPTETFASEVQGQEIADHRVEALVLPTRIFTKEAELNAGEKLVTHAKSHRASTIVSFGIDSSVRGFRLESTGRNWVENSRYSLPEENMRRLDDKEPSTHTLSIDPNKWNFSLLFSHMEAASVPYESKLSSDAGGYCCNALIYNTLRAMKKYGYNVPFLFLHCSCTEESIANMPEFDRVNKVLIKQTDIASALGAVLLATNETLS